MSIAYWVQQLECTVHNMSTTKLKPFLNTHTMATQKASRGFRYRSYFQDTCSKLLHGQQCCSGLTSWGLKLGSLGLSSKIGQVFSPQPNAIPKYTCTQWSKTFSNRIWFQASTTVTSSEWQVLNFSTLWSWHPQTVVGIVQKDLMAVTHNDLPPPQKKTTSASLI